MIRFPLKIKYTALTMLTALLLTAGCGEDRDRMQEKASLNDSGRIMAENQKKARAYRDSLQHKFEGKNRLKEKPDTAKYALIPESGHPGGYYVVSKGEYLAQIAGRIYGDPTKWYEIFAENEGDIDNYNKIYPGQRLQLPVK